MKWIAIQQNYYDIYFIDNLTKNEINSYKKLKKFNKLFNFKLFNFFNLFNLSNRIIKPSPLWDV